MVADWLVALVISVAVSVVSYLLMPKPKGPKPDAAAQAENPTAEAGKPKPVLFGTAMLSETNVLGFWDKSVHTYKVKV